MLVRFLCPACHQLLGIAPRKVGAQVNCPKCGATILVPDPGEPPAADVAEQSTRADFISEDLTAPDYTVPDFTGENVPPGAPPGLATAEEPPPDAVGSDVLGDITPTGRAEVRSTPPPSKRPSKPDLPLDDGDRIVISRRVLYFQAVLLAVVGVLALLAGYLIGSGTRLHGP